MTTFAIPSARDNNSYSAAPPPRRNAAIAATANFLHPHIVHGTRPPRGDSSHCWGNGSDEEEEGVSE